MNITEFAEQIVFGNSLEDKLKVPGKLSYDSDRAAGSKVDSLVAPGRPVGLEMRHGGASIQPPSDDKLENEKARGQLLHFLANHELLATELMALVLLKFPDAPHAFRQGVLVTLQEEQEHTRMYIRRMKECGVEFGSFPLSGQFWRIVEPMQSPMDFVSRLSLTFEQANLDYSLHFASVFRRLGDTATADVLQKIYEDEIGHVQHGLHWFRKWKDPEKSDWDAYQESLDFPMSPQRGRGPRGAFNRKGRMRAGLSEEFVDAIEVFRQSRGRSPSVRWFDAAAEAELEGGLVARTNTAELMEQLGKDLELVMVAMAKEDDVVAVRRMPSRAIRLQLANAGFDLPEFIPLEDPCFSELKKRKLLECAPWAWTPKNHALADPLISSAFHKHSPWHEEQGDLFRKSWGAECLGRWLDESIPDWFASKTTAGIPVKEVAEVAAALKELGDRGYETALFKQDLAAAGRGQRRFQCTDALRPEDESWLRSLESGKRQADRPMGVVEPELSRLIDLSLLWNVPPGSKTPEFLGWTRPLVSDSRRYVGTRLGHSLADCDSSLKRFVLEDRCAKIQAVVDWLELRLSRELAKCDFTGPFGVDAFVYRDGDGELKIKPLVELNPRTTMGHVALNLQKRLAAGVEAEFRILTRAEWASMHEDLAKVPFARLREKVTRDGLWKSGVIWLGEVDERTKLVPVMLIGSEALGLASHASRAFKPI